jgi:hypothetical protein
MPSTRRVITLLAHAVLEIYCTHPEVLVRSFLVLLGHGPWRRAREVASEAKKDAGCGNANHGIEEDLAAFAGRGLSTWAVGTEGDPVR